MACKKFNLMELQTIRESWKDIPVETVSKAKRKVFLDRKNAVNMYINGVGVKEIHNATGYDRTHIARLITKCLIINDDGEYYGYSALIPYMKVQNTEKKMKKASKSFSKLLSEYPTLPDYIAGCWHGNRKYTMETHMNVTTLHKDYFLKECERLGIQDYEYPFNTVNLAYNSLRKYVLNLNNIDAAARAKRSSKDDAQKIMSTGVGKRYTSVSIAPFSEVQVDGHIIDLLYTVEFTESDGTVSRNIATRAWFFPVFDTATRCVIGYSVSQEFNYNQYDVIRAVRNAILPHEKMEFTVPGLSYPENSGFPSEALPETKYAYFDRIMLDNAKSHLAEHVIDRMTRTLKTVMNFGSVATPETRGIIERFFGSLETRGFHKMSMTTGNSTRDLKRKDAEKKALETGITFDLICELLEVLVAQYNNTPHSGIGNKTPLECMERRIREAGLKPSIADKETILEVEKLENRMFERVVRGGKNGKRAYVTFEGAEYRGDVLSCGDRYIGHKVTLEVSPYDISTVEAYEEDGTYIGTLKARGEFGTKSHSLKTRKQARQYARERGREKTEFDTPITALTQHLDKQAKTSKRAATRNDIVRREIGEEELSKRVNKKLIVSPMEIGRTLNDKADNSKMPSNEELEHMTQKQLIERLYGRV
mgnify:CR=1 FL=1